jgi:hypothetical protein
MPLPELLLEEPEPSSLLPLPDEPESELLEPELPDPELLVPDVLVPLVRAVGVPANRNPERTPVTAMLEIPIAVVIPTAVRRPVDRMSISGPPSRPPPPLRCGG